MGRKDGFDFRVQDRDVFAQGAQWVQEAAPLDDGHADAGFLGGQGHGFFNELQPLCPQLGPAQRVRVAAAFDHPGLGGLESDQVRPAAQEIHRQIGVQRADQFEGLGIVVAQQAGDLVEELGAAVHDVAPGLDQAGQFEGLGILGFQGAEFGSVIARQFQEHARIGQVIAGARGGEGLAVTGAGDGVDGIDRQPGMLDQGVDDGAAAGLDGQGHGPCAEAFFQAAQPGVEGIRVHVWLCWIWTRGAVCIVRDVGRRHLRMRIRVRVRALVERLR